MSQYNATVYRRPANPETGEGWEGVFVAYVEEIGGRLQMLRGNGIQCTGYEMRIATFKAGSELEQKYGPGEHALYDVYLRERQPDTEFEIVLDNCAGYKARLAGLALPPSYRGETHATV